MRLREPLQSALLGALLGGACGGCGRSASDLSRASALSREAEERMRLGDFQGARDSFRAAAALDPGSPAHQLGWGTAARALDHFPEALEALERARSLSGPDARILYELGETLRLSGSPGRAEELLREACRLDPGRGAAAYSLALALADLGRYAEAARLAGDILRRAEAPAAMLHQAEAPLRFLLASSLERMGRREEAARERARFEELARREAEVRKEGIAVESDPGSLPSRLRLASALRRADRFREASESYAACLRLDPRSAPAAGGQSLCLALLAGEGPGGGSGEPARLEEAEAAARRALRLGETAEARAALGWIAHLRGEGAAARREMGAAVALEGADDGIRELAGRAGAGR